ncbi:hypothetical protein TL16_g05258 [Triparma laevis f. inornata]|uniref:Kinesin-like protein n=1 Tax=Triparma laevis f. inornata TaxID=1714386 RepID=A0A9W7ALA9_9STRA|nr:hypothetical protein TL16_g05258 [Triparma laevis f. inornata]
MAPFTPSKEKLMKELDLLPPATPNTPDVLDSSLVQSLEADTSITPFSKLERVLAHDDMLVFLPVSEYGTMAQLSKDFNKAFGDRESVWRMACLTFAVEKELYLPYPQLEKIVGSWKRIFFEQLFPARMKWGVEEVLLDENGLVKEGGVKSDFKIQVACRFRPGERKKSSILLPLHQRLRLLRKQQKQNANASLGSTLPEKFIDPLMGGVMNSPVKLPSSGRVCERKVVSQHLKVDHRDPFDKSSLNTAALIACPELKAEIVEWKNKKQTALFAEAEDENKKSDGGSFRVASDDVKALTEAGGDITPEILQALLEADRLETAIRDAEEQAEKEKRMRENRGRRKFDKWGDEVTGGNNQENVESTTTAAAAATTTNSDSTLPSTTIDKVMEEKAKEDDMKLILNQPHNRDARILAVEKSRVLMHIDGRGIRPFLMSGGCFTEYAGQKDVYEHCGRAPVISSLNGLNACLLAYGQTGSGKTHTMFGPEGVLNEALEKAKERSESLNWNVHDVAKTVLEAKGGEVGLAVRACAEICKCLNLDDTNSKSGNIVGQLTCEYVQIYNEKITCLLGSTNEVKMRGDIMQGARTVKVTSLPMMLSILVLAEQNKKRAATAMNERSSRAHSILVFNISQKNTLKNTIVNSVLHLVDLAGSERVKKSKVEGINCLEAININKSLMVLGKCVSALVDKKSHVPYFESKLTSILRNSLGGNSRTTAVIAARMNDEHANETLQSLRFGERCASITNSVAVAATNATEAVEAIDRALKMCERQIESLEKRGMKHLECYKQVKEKYATLKIKRSELE